MADKTDNKDGKVIIDVAIPAGWRELTQKQLMFVFDLIGRGESKESLLTHCFLKWSGVKVLTRDKDNGDYMLSFKKHIFGISAIEMAEWMKPLEWLTEIPDFPVHIAKIGRHKAVAADFHEVIFDKYIDAVYLWNTFVTYENEAVFPLLVEVLYGFKPRKLKPWLKSCIIYWMSSLNRYLAAEYPHLFGGAKKNADGTGTLGGGAPAPIEESVNAMLRALTKGDVLKEKDVLKVDTHRALTELEALGREFDELKAQMKKNGKV